MRNNELRKKLSNYGALVAAMAGATEADGAVIYTDENPDFTGGIGSQYFLDLNNDAIDDFRIWHNGGSNLYISPLAATNDVLGSGGATYAYPFTLSNGAMISNGAGQWNNNGFSGGYQSLNYGSCSFGNWCTVTDKYVGLRFDIGGNIHYGWARLDVDAAGANWVLKDYAYENTPNTAITAGALGFTAADTPSGIVGTDVANNNNGTDLQVDFNAATDETTISEYRVIAVKAAAAPAFDEPTASALAASAYATVTPAGGPYSLTLGAAQTDSDGDPIAQGQPYKIFVLSVADGVNATVNSITSSTGDVTLVNLAFLAQNIVPSDVADNANGSDLQVDFDAATDETTVGEYRVIAVKFASSGSFDEPTASALASTAYTSVAPTGGPYSVTMGTTQTDSDGDPIALGEVYSIFVLSIADGVNATMNNLGFASTTITLNAPADVASGIMGSDVSDNSDATDLQADFTAAANEATIGEYRVIAVKTAQAGSFTEATASALAATAYESVAPSGGPYSITFNSATTDSDGDAIVIGQPYTLFVLSVADGTNANQNEIASAASSVTLYTYADVATGVVGFDIGNVGDGSDAQIYMDAAMDESTLTEYRIMIVKDANAASFDLAAAQAVGAADYTMVAPNASPSYATTLAAAATDVDGDAIAENVPYQAFVLSIMNGTTTNMDALSSGSATFTLLPNMTTGIEENGMAQLSVATILEEFVVEVPQEWMTGKMQVSLFNAQGQLVHNMDVVDSSIRIQRSELSNGVYVLNLQDGKGMSHSVRLMN